MSHALKKKYSKIKTRIPLTKQSHREEQGLFIRAGVGEPRRLSFPGPSSVLEARGRSRAGALLLTCHTFAMRESQVIYVKMPFRREENYTNHVSKISWRKEGLIRIVSWSREERAWSSTWVLHLGKKIGGERLRGSDYSLAFQEAWLEKRKTKGVMQWGRPVCFISRSEIRLCFYSEPKELVQI